MFSLIITIIAIALVAILAIAVIYYGGSSMQKGPALAAAATLINQSTQIAAAGALSTVDGHGWPTAALVFPTNYLQAPPLPPRSAYVPGIVPAESDWEYYMPGTDVHHFVVRDKINKDACLAVNQKVGFNGIPAAWDGTSIIQCFGTGTNGAYTFFYDPPQSVTENQDALDESLDQGNTTTPGYPRLCADGTTITSGICSAVSGEVGTPPVTPANPPVPADDNTIYHLASYPGTTTIDGVSQWGDSYAEYCATDAPAATFGMDSLLVVAGVQLPINDAWDQCVSTEMPAPVSAVGTYSVELTSATGKKALGSTRYIDNLEMPAVVYDISPSEFPYKDSTTTTITGRNFNVQSVVTDGATTLPTTFIDSEHLSFVVPPAKAMGFTEETLLVGDIWMSPGTFYVQNPKGGASDVFGFYYTGSDLPPPKLYSVTATPSVVNTNGRTLDGSNQVTYCMPDAPFYTFKQDSVVTIKGIELPIVSASDYCLTVDNSPALTVGNYPVVVTNPGGDKASGQLRYVTEVVETPVINGFSPSEMPYNVTTPVTMTGYGFTPQSVVMANSGAIVPSTFVSSTEMKLQVPPASVFGYTGGVMYHDDPGAYGNMYVTNPNSDDSGYNGIYFYGDGFNPDGPPPPTDEECADNPYQYGCPVPDPVPTEEECLEDPTSQYCDVSQYTALRISDFGNAYGMTLTAVKDCSPLNAGGDYCLPVFHSQVRTWRWTPPSSWFVSLDENETDGRLSYVLGSAKGVIFSDGTNAYTLSEMRKTAYNYTYSYISEYNAVPMLAPGETGGGLGRLGVSCDIMQADVVSRGGYFLPGTCSSIQTGAQYSWTIFGSYWDYGQGSRNESAVMRASMYYTTDVQNWGPFLEGFDYDRDHATLHAPGGIDQYPLAVGAYPSEISEEHPLALTNGASGGWPVAPLTTDVSHVEF